MEALDDAIVEVPMQGGSKQQLVTLCHKCGERLVAKLLLSAPILENARLHELGIWRTPNVLKPSIKGRRRRLDVAICTSARDQSDEV